MNRIELLDILKRAQPALSNRDLVPILACFCFDGERVTAYDDVVAIQAPSAFPVKGAVKGKLLMEFLSASRARDLEVEGQEGPEGANEMLTLKAGRSRLKLPLLSEAQFMFKVPSTAGATRLPLDAAIIQAIKKCSISIGVDPATPWRFGITVSFKDNMIHFYASDNLTIAHAEIPRQTKDEFSTVLPPRFAELLADLSGSDVPEALTVTKKWVMAEFKSGLRLFARAVAEVRVKKYLAMIESVMGGPKAKLHEIPKGLGSSLERAQVVLTAVGERYTEFVVKDGKLRMSSASSTAQVRDFLNLTGHPDIAIRCPPKLIERALPYSERLAFVSGKCVIMQGQRFTYLASVIQGE